MEAPVADEILEFEGWRFALRTRDLLRQDAEGLWVPVQVGSRALNILARLLDRPGSLVSKDSIMDAAWPNVAVAPNNLTVQITALRKILDEGRAGESCIQAVSGRGYRLVLPVSRVGDAPGNTQGSDGGGRSNVKPTPLSAPTALPEPRTSRPLWFSAGLCGITLVGLLAVIGLHTGWFGKSPARPRLSLVVLPFENLSDDRADSYLAEGITDDLTSDLAHIPDAMVIARESAYTYKSRPENVSRIGEELGVRYALEGSVRRIGPYSKGQRPTNLNRIRRNSLVGPVRRAGQRAGGRTGPNRHAHALGRRDQPDPGREGAQFARTSHQPERIRSDFASAGAVERRGRRTGAAGRVRHV